MDPYKILGLTPAATDAQIKKAWRVLAQRLHPDRDGGDTARYQEIQKAYDLLTDPVRRAYYDATGKSQQPPTLRDNAKVILLEVFQLSLSQYDSWGGDITKIMRAKVDAEISADWRKIEGAKAQLQKRQALLPRLGYKGDGDNMLAAKVSEDITSISKHLDQLKEHAEVLKELLIVLDDYSWNELLLQGSSGPSGSSGTTYFAG